MNSTKENSALVLSELREVFDRFDFSAFDTLIEAVHEAKRVFLMGVGREGLATRAFAMRLMHTGKTVHWCWDDTTPNVGEGDVFIFTSGSGEIGHIHYVMEQVRPTGAKIVLVTGVPDRKSSKLADLIIHVPASVFHGDDRVVPSIQPMGNLFEQSLFILFDLCIMQYVETYRLETDQVVARHRNFE